MNPGLIGLIGGIVGGIVGVAGGLLGTYFSIKNTKGPRERAFVIKASIVSWIFVLTFVFGMCLTPGLYKLFLIPIYVVCLVACILLWNKKQTQIRLEESKKYPAVPYTQIIPRKCPQCGAELRPDLSEGLCPACLLQRGIATEGGAPPGTPPFTPPTIPDLAKLFPQLEILELIGKGGMGAVYKARQPALDRFVALKILAPRSGGDLDFAERFTREARALARLSHPNIVAVYDFGQTGGLSYFIMEHVDGPNLRQVEQAGRLSPREALEIIPQICGALQFAHDEGIVHRDIKPENVLLDKKGRVKIADFGLAKILGQEPKDFRLTGVRDVVGTPHYMAPEQIEKPSEVDHRADIYSLGVVFYEMLTGELPLGKFQPPSSCARGMQIDVRLDEVVLHALEKEPARRYQHVSEIKTQVETIASSPEASSSRREEAPFESQSLLTSAATIPFSRVMVQFAAFGSAILFACLVLLLAMSSDAIDRKTWSYFRLGFEILAAAVFAGFLFVIHRATKTKTPEAWRTVKSWLPTIIVTGIGILFGFWSPHFNLFKSDYIGQSWFPKGDSIEITSVGRSADRMIVKGHYTLVSHDNAELALYITTSTNIPVPEDRQQRMQISKGRGDFELIDSHLVPGLPHVSMYADGESFAALYFGTRAEALEESRASWITNVTPASAETWSPALGPGERPDPDKVLKEAKELIKPAHYEESLQRFIWYHDHAAEFSTNLTSGWLINALSDWVELGRRYPKAKQALIEIRDRKDQEFHEGRGYFELFMEINSINDYLQCQDDTCALFKFIEEKDPKLARQCFIVAESALMNRHEYAWCLRYIGDGPAAFERIRQDWEREKQWQQSMDQNLAEAYQRMGRTNLFPQRPEMSKLSDDRFVGEVRQLIEILIGTGHQADAEKIRDEAVAVLDDARLKSAVGDAEEKIQKCAAPDSQPQTQDAVSAAQKWLALIDRGNYSESWKQASAVVQGAATEPSFVNLMNTFRQPLGDLASRKLKSAQRMTELPGAPDGQYVVMQFETSFAGKKSTIETVTFMLEKDGQWKSAGYFIK